MEKLSAIQELKNEVNDKLFITHLIIHISCLFFSIIISDYQILDGLISITGSFLLTFTWLNIFYQFYMTSEFKKENEKTISGWIKLIIFYVMYYHVVFFSNYVFTLAAKDFL